MKIEKITDQAKAQDWFREQVSRKIIPDNINKPHVFSDINGRVGWRFFVKLKEESIDGNHNPIFFDNIIIGVGMGTSTLTEKEAIKKASQGLWFCTLNKEKSLKIIQDLEKSGHFDIDLDTPHGHILSALLLIPITNENKQLFCSFCKAKLDMSQHMAMKMWGKCPHCEK